MKDQAQNHYPPSLTVTEKLRLQETCWTAEFAILQARYSTILETRALADMIKEAASKFGKPAQRIAEGGVKKIREDCDAVVASFPFEGELKSAMRSRAKDGGVFALLILHVALICLKKTRLAEDPELIRLADLAAKDPGGKELLERMKNDASISLAEDFLACYKAAKSGCDHRHPTVCQLFHSVIHPIEPDSWEVMKHVVGANLYELVLSCASAKKEALVCGFLLRDVRRTFVELLSRIHRRAKEDIFS